jgi:hypothetical protein
MLLESAIEEAKLKKTRLTICWLDLANAFGSLPHYFLHQLFQSLPIPTELRDILSNIYTNSIFQFVVNKELVTVHPTSGVCQIDSLSSIIFNLAAEPLINSMRQGSFLQRVSSLWLPAEGHRLCGRGLPYWIHS